MQEHADDRALAGMVATSEANGVAEVVVALGTPLRFSKVPGINTVEVTMSVSNSVSVVVLQTCSISIRLYTDRLLCLRYAGGSCIR